jgi:peptidoglycan/LPS O-acetylase OafA/YrhL
LRQYSLTTRHRYREIDVLRGFAALWVVLSHYSPHWNGFLGGGAPEIVSNHAGIYALYLFFAISGFVIFMTLDRCKTVFEFARMRFARLYPAYWAALTFVAVVSVVVFGQEFWLGGFLANATMFHEFMNVQHFDNVFWSLSVELAFYLNAAWLLATKRHTRVMTIVLVWLAAACLWALWIRDPAAETRDWAARLFALDYAPFFAIGLVFYEIARGGWSRTRVGLLALAIVAETVLIGIEGMFVAAAVSILLGLAIAGWLRPLVSRVTLWLGTISFSLYLVHRNLGYLTLDWLHGNGIAPLVAIPLTIAAALLLASLLAYGVEKPMLKRLRPVRDQG